MTEQQQGQVPPNPARRTIKLKPLTKKVPKVMMTPEQLAQAEAAESASRQASQGASIMQTGSQEIRPAAVPAPTVISPVITQKAEPNDTIVLTPPTATVPEAPADDSTKKVGKQAAQASPLTMMPSGKQTIKLRPTPVPSATTIPGAPKMPGAPTIKLSPTPSPTVPSVSESVDEEIFDDKTVAMSRPARTAQPTTTPGSLIPSASAPTLNMTPSQTQTAVPVGGAITPASPTLKLKPTLTATATNNVITPAAQQAPTPAPALRTVAPSPAASAVQPKSPTIKLKVNTSSITQSSPAAPVAVPPPPAPAESQEVGTTSTVPTLKLKAPTATNTNLPPPPSAGAVDMSKSKLQIKKSPPPPSVKEGELAPSKVETYSEQQAKEAAGEVAEAPAEAVVPVTERAEPSIIFTVAAILAFCAVSFVVFMTSWQYYLQWMKQDASSSAVSAPAIPKAKAKPAAPAPAAASPESVSVAPAPEAKAEPAK